MSLRHPLKKKATRPKLVVFSREGRSQLGPMQGRGVVGSGSGEWACPRRPEHEGRAPTGQGKYKKCRWCGVTWLVEEMLP